MRELTDNYVGSILSRINTRTTGLDLGDHCVHRAINWSVTVLRGGGCRASSNVRRGRGWKCIAVAACDFGRQALQIRVSSYSNTGCTSLACAK